MAETKDPWSTQLSETSKPYTDMSLPPWALNVEQVATGIALLGGVFLFGPEMLAAEGAYEATSAGSTIASSVISGTYHITTGAVGLASGRDMSDVSKATDTAFKPIETAISSTHPEAKPVLEGVDVLKTYWGALKGDALEAVNSVVEGIEKLDLMGQDLDKLNRLTDFNSLDSPPSDQNWTEEKQTNQQTNDPTATPFSNPTTNGGIIP